MKLATPSTSHIPSAKFEEWGIYEPAEDSFLLIDTLSSEAERAFLRSRFGSQSQNERGRSQSTTPLVLEVGTGSGVIIAFLTAHAEYIFGREDVLTMAVDVNDNAVKEGRKTVEAAVRDRCSETAENAAGVNGDDVMSATAMGVFTDILLSDLTSCLRKESVDVLVFNPPYVPTENLPELPLLNGESWQAMSKFERESQLLALAYAGGEDGMETTDRLLRELDVVLSERGVAYVLLCARNMPDEVMRKLREGIHGGRWKVEIVGESGGRGGWERLCVVRIWRDGDQGG